MTAVQLMNIQRLLEAAEYLDRRERECEHGYASTFPSSIQNTNYQRQNKFRNKKFHNNHNSFVPNPEGKKLLFAAGVVCRQAGVVCRQVLYAGTSKVNT
uniref:Max interactor 1, dimerization protein n=1 Tax=Salmo trutta TaxID=8032 RepID=A0A674CCK4_SALTR